MRVYSLASINQEPAPWEELRPRPTRALGGGERMLMTADPRIPDKISKKQRELDRIAAEDAAKAEMLRLKAEKDAACLSVRHLFFFERSEPESSRIELNFTRLSFNENRNVS